MPRSPSISTAETCLFLLFRVSLSLLMSESGRLRPCAVLSSSLDGITSASTQHAMLRAHWQNLRPQCVVALQSPHPCSVLPQLAHGGLLDILTRSEESLRFLSAWSHALTLRRRPPLSDDL